LPVLDRRGFSGHDCTFSLVAQYRSKFLCGRGRRGAFSVVLWKVGVCLYTHMYLAPTFCKYSSRL